MSASRIMARLEGSAAVNPGAEHEIDLLRQILLRQRGTDAQRAMLVRLIASEKTKPSKLMDRLYTSLCGGGPEAPKTTYV